MSKFCNVCGKPAQDDALFCQFCGAKFQPTNPLNDIPRPNIAHINTPPPPIPKADKEPKKEPKAEQKIEQNVAFDTHNIPNPQSRNARIGVFVSLIGAIGMYLGISETVDMMAGGGALIFVGLFVVIMGVVVWAIYRKRAAILDEMIQGKNRIAAWYYDSQMWRDYTEREKAERGAQNKATFIIIIVFMVIVCVGMLVATGFDEASIIVTIGMLGFAIFLGIIAALTVWLPYRRRAALSGGRVLFSSKSIWVEGDFYEWSSIGMRLEGIEYEADENLLIVAISAPNRTGRITQIVRLPVPKGEKATAQKIIHRLSKPH
jgi:hypothetical protein